ncbi:hypothetical protein [Halalkalibacter krulwichiae]|uniref:Uncharacterized protein n=1 Tax=Halalkalibacter krulwichiae TaxID=199441 RepID=A0A1X9MB41_9BACI|nr:hypothetical protein [Halalkalibacter krulwichiae]ARK29864.1 hypothetical protein BkAM31D_08310 [Halalkalibacter krulwichiae]
MLKKKETTNWTVSEPIKGLIAGVIMMIVVFSIAYFVFGLVPFS